MVDRIPRAWGRSFGFIIPFVIPYRQNSKSYGKICSRTLILDVQENRNASLSSACAMYFAILTVNGSITNLVVLITLATSCICY